MTKEEKKRSAEFAAGKDVENARDFAKERVGGG